MVRTSLLVVGLLLAPAVRAGADDARVWIARMNEALSTRSYDGVFTHVMGNRREVMRIIHRMHNGRMAERLVSTDGSGREFVRNGTEWIAYFPDRRMAVVETRNRSFGFISTLKGLSAESERYYTIRSVGSRRVLGKAAQIVHVEPRDALRYGYRFWLDEKTAMPLMTQLVTDDGAVLEEIAFISLTLPESISDDLLKADVDTTGYRWLRRDGGPQAAPQSGFKPRADRLPPGFDVRLPNEAPGSQSAAPRSRFIVSDGIAWVSVFVEVASAKPRVAPHGAAARPDGVVQMGSSAAYVAQVQGYRVTVVGEVPARTVRAIAEAVLPE
jgi:sigma-E factor negative regulatory protein RseB